MVAISVDDLFNIIRFRDAFGVHIQTPNLDRLMSMGTTYDNAYASTAICNSSRTSVLSGLSPFSSGVHRNDQAWFDHVDPSSTLPAIMKDAGWFTASFGKNFHGDMPADISGRLFDTYLVETGNAWSRDKITVEAATDFLLNYKDEKPLFAMIGLRDPHTPYDVPQEYLDMYPLEQIKVPLWTGDEPPAFIKALLGISGERPPDLERTVQLYLANVSEMDARLGEILDAIKESRLDPNIILYSDHGFSLGDHDVVGKFNLWEQAISAPLIVVDPDGVAGVVNHDVVSFLDIMPTILDLVGLSHPSGLEGTSLLEGGSGYAISTVYGSTSIRIGDWRYTHYEDGSIELFNLASDPACADNLHGDPAFAEPEAKLLSALESHLADIGVTISDGLTIHEAANGDTDYFVTDTAQLAQVVDSGGHDIVYLTLAADGTLPAWAEDALMTHKAKALHFTGNRSDNLLIDKGGTSALEGRAGDDTIFGNKGTDTLIGGAGADQLHGGPGVDVLMGGGGDDLLLGDTGRDILKGGMGSDSMQGGFGNDLYFVTDDGDTVVETPGPNIDKVCSSISYTLGPYVERLLLLGTGDISGRGNSSGNVIVGNAGDNVLNGKGGRDILTGGAGADVFVFNTALAAGNVDVVTDFNVALDTLHLDKAVFTTLVHGTLNTSAFHIGSAAAELDDRIIYNAATGALLYDSDGTGSSSPIQFATISPGLSITNVDFSIT